MCPKLLILFFFSAFSAAKIDGISLRIDQGTIDRALAALAPAIIAIVKEMDIADVSQSFTIGKALISNIKIVDLKFVSPPFVSLNNGRFCLRSSKVATKLLMNIYVSMLMSLTAGVEADITIQNFLMCFQVDLDLQRKFVVTVTEHTVVISDMFVVLKDETHNVRTLMTGLLGLVNEAIRSSINNFLDQDLSKNVEQALAKQIERTKPRAYLSPKNGVFLDFTPEHPPIFADGVTYSTRGYTFQEKNWAVDHQHTQKPDEIPKFEEGFGLTCYMNDFVLRNLVGVLWANTELFQQTFSEKSAIIPIDFTVAGFSKIFQRLDEKYPKHLPTMLRVKLSQAPNIKIRNDYISVFVRADVTAMVIPEEGKKPVIFGEFSVIAVVDAFISLEDIRTLKIVPRNSTIIDMDRFILYGVLVDRELINQTVNGAIQLFINYFGFAHRTALDVIQKTIDFESTKLTLADNLLVFAANLNFKTLPADFFSSKKTQKPTIAPGDADQGEQAKIKRQGSDTNQETAPVSDSLSSPRTISTTAAQLRVDSPAKVESAQQQQPLLPAIEFVRRQSQEELVRRDSGNDFEKLTRI